MNVILIIGGVILTISGFLLLVRTTLGPTMLDRVISLDVVTSIAICSLGLEAAVNQHTNSLPILVALSLLGFIGSVSVASFTKGSELVEEDHA